MGSSATTSAQPRPDRRIAGLDGLRAISILLVLIGHAWPTVSHADPTELSQFFGNGSLGVTTFFVISGYLITYLLRREWEKTGTIRLRAFYARRIFRIFPAFYMYLLAMTLLRVFGYIDTTYGDLAVAGTFLSNYRQWIPVSTNADSWFVAQFWTLSLEEQFYLFWPTTLFVFGVLRAPRVAMIIVVAEPLLRVATYFVTPSARGQVQMMVHTNADALMFGCLAALWEGKPNFERLINRFSSWQWPAAAAFFLFVVSLWLGFRLRGRYVLPVGMSLNAGAVAFILAWVVRHPTSALCRALSTPVVRHIGVLSYSLYLWQQPFLTIRNSTWSGVFPINVLASFAAAELSYWLVESPFLRLRDRWRRVAPRSPTEMPTREEMVKEPVISKTQTPSVSPPAGNPPSP
jgi:peptidoglycan/LPS O-acetylase OafA/YrhL